MRIAIVDLGTNSVRFDIQELHGARAPLLLYREKLMVRLGQGVFTEGRLDPEAIRRTVQAFVAFRHTAELLQADKIVAFATSALREASDARALLRQVRSRAGIDVRVISGEEEARLIAEGVLENEKPVKGRFALVDIGGGSTEVSVCRGKKVLRSTSFPLGTARLQQIFLKSSPPRAGKGDADPVTATRRHVRSIMLAKMYAEDWPKAPRIVGSSGTIRGLARILKKTRGAKAVTRKDLRDLVKRMRKMTTTQLLGIPGMEAKRVDMILAGAILLEECMDALGTKTVVPTEFSLREGILAEEALSYRRHAPGPLVLHLQDLREKAARLGVNPAHSNQVTALAERLFDVLKPLHRLAPAWKPYLAAAAILHDVGEAVSPINHAQHSYYIVSNADIPSLEPWEREFIAELCLRHVGGKVDEDELAQFPEPGMRKAFVKLLALLMVADALDRGHQAHVTVARARVTRKSVELKVGSKADVGLELLRLEQKKALFEEVFRRELVTTRA